MLRAGRRGSCRHRTPRTWDFLRDLGPNPQGIFSSLLPSRSALGGPPTVGAHGDVDGVETREVLVFVKEAGHRLEMRHGGRPRPW